MTLALAALAPERFRTHSRRSRLRRRRARGRWGWNHVARQILKLDPGYLEQHRSRARNHAPAGRSDLSGRARFRRAPAEARPSAGACAPGAQLPSSTKGCETAQPFRGAGPELQLDAMDHHDLLQLLPGDDRPAINRVKAATIVADVDTDQLFPTMQAETLVAQLRKSSPQVERATIRSIHGHDAFLIEWDTLGPILTRALQLKPS